MSDDLFELLAETPVPPVPLALSQGVHRRLNRALVVLHLVEFVVCVLPYGLLHFARGVVGCVMLTVSGRYPDDRPSGEKA